MRKYNQKESGLPNEAEKASTLGSSAESPKQVSTDKGTPSSEENQEKNEKNAPKKEKAKPISIGKNDNLKNSTTRFSINDNYGVKKIDADNYGLTEQQANDYIEKSRVLLLDETPKQAKRMRRREERERKKQTKEIYDIVLSEQFDDVSLRRINDYINDVTPNNPYGRRISYRVPQAVERKVYGNPQKNAIDLLFSRISESAVPEAERRSEEGRRAIEERKKELLKAWAIATDNWHTDLNEFVSSAEPIGEGTDSKVYAAKENGYVIKASKGKPYGKRFRADIDNVPLFNYYFPNTKYDILGYGEIDGDFVRILRQPIVDFSENASLSEEERVDYMKGLGFTPINKQNTAFTNSNFVVADLQKANIVKDRDGNISVIDADMKLHTADIGGNYTYPPVENDTRFSISDGTLTEQAKEEMQAIKDEAINNGTFMKAPNGKPTNLNERQWLQVRTKAFKKWFGDWENDPENASKVVDENGEPKVMYHGTPNLFTVFAPEKSAGMMMFTDDTSLAEKFANKRSTKGTVIKAFLNVRAPKDFEMDGYDWSGRGIGENYKSDINKGRKTNFSYLEARKAKRQGYDGTILHNVTDSGVKSNHYIVYSPSQIKSATSNNGEFSAGNGDIRFAISEAMDEEYMQAVESGDMETAQRMVNEAAKAAMPNTKVVDEKGEPRVVWHWTPEEFTAFDPATIGSTNPSTFLEGFYFSDIPLGKEGDGGRRMSLFLSINNPMVIDLNKTRLDSIGVQEMVDALQRGSTSYYKEYLLDSGECETEEEADDVAEEMRDKMDGVVINNIQYDWHNIEYIAFYPSQIKSADPVTYDNNGNVIPLSKRFNKKNKDIRFSIANSNQEIFVSNAARAVEAIKQEKATPQQWLAMIEKNGGLKAGEDKWLGLSDFLKESKEKTLSKQQLLDFINQNMIRIEEVKYDESVVGSEDEWDEIKSIFDDFCSDIREYQWDEIKESYEEPEYDENDESFDEEVAYNDMLEYIEERMPDDEEIASMALDKLFANYPQWKGKLKLDGDVLKLDRNVLKLDRNVNQPIDSTRLRFTTEGLENKREIALTVPTIEPWNKDDEIHFGDAGGGRAVAWVRFGETTDADENRVLVIDEIQSKRHQEGREKGYKKTSAYVPENDIEKSIKNYIEYCMSQGDSFSVAVGYAYNQITDAPQESVGWTQETVDKVANAMKSEGVGDIPDAPFEKNWHELAMKRMLRLAAEEGYDKVAWTTGEQQAERYGLGGKVKKIAARDEGDMGKIVNIQFKEDARGFDNMNFAVNDEGIIDSKTRPELDGKPLADVVGKELALKIMNVKDNQPVIFDGEDLRIGGEGMKGFYDKMLPSFVQKYTKKWGAKVGEIELPNLEEAAQKMWSVDVTPEMKESVMQGQTMFSIGEVNDRFNAELQQQIDGTQEKGHTYQLGMPSEILISTGFPNMPIELSASHLTDKRLQKNHPFDLKDVKNLPQALQEPIAVFKYGNETKAQNVIVELKHGDKNFLVGVHFNQERDGAEVSSIRGLFPKDNAEWLNWIAQNKSLYLDKEKIQTFINQQQINLADVEYLDLDLIQSKIKDFENPKLLEKKIMTPKNTSLDEVLFSIKVNHNSPYLLKRADGSFIDPETGERLGFDHRFMGEGEGAQVHGWGSYFSVEDIRRYAKTKDEEQAEEAWGPEYDNYIDAENEVREKFGIEDVMLDFGVENARDEMWKFTTEDMLEVAKRAADYYGEDWTEEIGTGDTDEVEGLVERFLDDVAEAFKEKEEEFFASFEPENLLIQSKAYVFN